eukprot:CAMPEP_0194179374 /NCGR_PEP_ID=MMETSP0154-20130528/12846_1 /TAXON_ID=1049557 /ORGANISM="Thalassiothrix antarctica, Strain L6-D1" /LENGTH=146 /DNA_ID=CAMNT_0038894707 /DNA_START=49 /DNA_END=489 /DNA_ORIENTATION=-
MKRGRMLLFYYFIVILEVLKLQHVESLLLTTHSFSHDKCRRRNVLKYLAGFSAVTLSSPSFPAVAASEESPKKAGSETVEEQKSRLLKEKIAASKKNYRKADSYMNERFTTVDYSCVADTGSPCKEPKSVFPSDEKIRLDGKIPDL